jgi:phenylacetate-CoA ligase
MSELTTIERVSRDELERVQLGRLQQLVARAAERVPLYRERLREAGVTAADIRSLADVRRLPFTVKDDFRASYPYGLLAVPLDDVVRIHASSGTTGKPTVVASTSGARRWRAPS